MKKLVLLFTLLCLMGCSISDSGIKKEITEELNLSSVSEPLYYTTMSKPLYSYYLPKDVGRIKSNQLSSLFIKDNVKFIMNFNPNEVVVHDYYQNNAIKSQKDIQINRNSDLYYEASGTFKGSNGSYHDYTCQIIQLDKQNYFLLLDMEYVNFSAVLKRVQIKPLIHSMFIMAKSLQYQSKEVVEEYSLKSTSQSIKQDLDEFNEELPNNGLLEDLYQKGEK